MCVSMHSAHLAEPGELLWIARHTNPSHIPEVIEASGLMHTRIKQLSPLAACTSVTSLSLMPETASIGTLASCTGLRSLKIFSKYVVDLSPVASLGNSLTQLDLSIGTDYGRVSTDICALAACKVLTALRLCCTGLKSIDCLASCTALTQLDLFSSTITDLGPLVSCARLAHVRLSLNTCSLRALAASKASLTYLDIKSCYTLAFFAILAEFKSLTYLTLAATRIMEVEALSESTSLTHLDLSHTQVCDISRWPHVSAWNS